MGNLVGNIQQVRNGQLSGPGFTIKDEKGRLRLTLIFKSESEAKAAAKSIATVLSTAISVAGAP